MTCGIYALKFKNTDKVYIGQSINIEERLLSHIYKMKNGISSKRLNEAYNKYGIPNIEILTECTVDELNNLEIQAIEIFDSITNGFNTLSENGGGNYTVGELHCNSKNSNEVIEEVFKLLIKVPVITIEDISAITGVSYAVIADISKGDNHKWLSNKYPEEYLILMNLKNNRKSAYALGKNIPKVISPNGSIFSIFNIRAFSKEHRLNQSSLGKLLNGKAKTHKGWTTYKGELS